MQDEEYIPSSGRKQKVQTNFTRKRPRNLKPKERAQKQIRKDLKQFEISRASATDDQLSQKCPTVLWRVLDHFWFDQIEWTQKEIWFFREHVYQQVC